MRQLFGKPEGSWLVAAVLACGLLAAALFLPLWKMELVAPQYPKGLMMYAYGDRFQDDPSSPYEDIREINGLNHYIGMKPIEEVTEMRLFVPGMVALIAGTVLVSFVAWKRKWLKAVILASFWFMPVFFVADLQYWLYNYGHTMDPDAALDTGAFTPKVIGTTKVWNFHSETSFEIGFYAMLLAAAVITFLPPAIRLIRRRRGRQEPTRERVTRTLLGRRGQGMVMKVLLLAAALGGAALPLARADAQVARLGGGSLQQRIEQAAPGDTIFIDGGVFNERIIIDKAVSLIGRNWPVIDGGGQGDVVTIVADDVTLSGFVVRGSGRSLSQEPAAIKVNEVDRVTLRGNRVEESHFGIYVLGSEGSTIAFNEVDPGGDTPIERRGHGIYLWEVSGTVVHENTVRNAADGIHLEFSEGNGIGSNVVTKSRYGLHFMYANDNRMTGNTFRDNLAGAVLMFSHDLLLKDNEFSSNRRGATGAGILLKDVDNVFAEGNRLLRNKYGLTVEGTPQSIGATAVFLHNLLALNDTGLALMSNAPITFVENSLIDNTVQVKALGGELASRVMSSHSGGAAHEQTTSTGSDQPALPTGAVWTSNGRGNYWSDYRGYDADGDGVGDRAYRPEPPFAGQLERDETLRLFQFTPAQQALDMAADMFPLYRYNPVMEDSGPLMEPPEGPALPRDGSFNRELLVASLFLVGAAYAGVAGVLGIDAGQAVRRGLSLAARTAGGSKPA